MGARPKHVGGFQRKSSRSRRPVSPLGPARSAAGGHHEHERWASECDQPHLGSSSPSRASWRPCHSFGDRRPWPGGLALLVLVVVGSSSSRRSKERDAEMHGTERKGPYACLSVSGTKTGEPVCVLCCARNCHDVRTCHGK